MVKGEPKHLMDKAKEELIKSKLGNLILQFCILRNKAPFPHYVTQSLIQSRTKSFSQSVIQCVIHI